MIDLSNGLAFACVMGNNSAPFTQTDYVGGNHLIAPIGILPVDYLGRSVVELVSYQVGSGFNLRSIGTYLSHADAPAFKANTGAFTACIRVKVNKFLNNDFHYTLFEKHNEYVLQIGHVSGSIWRPNAVFNMADGSTAPVTVIGNVAVGEWNTFILEVDEFGWGHISFTGQTSPVGKIQLGFGPLASGTNEFWVGATLFSPGTILSAISADISDLYIWRRTLTNEEITSLLGGATYPFKPAPTDCGTVPCCNDPSEPAPYVATNATPSGTEVNSLCSPVPVVSIDPPANSVATFPTLVFLHTARSDATMYYTTDGTTPTTSSTQYTGPFSITSQHQIIKAFAIVVGCDPGPIAVAQYLLAASIFKFGYSCDTTDKVGQWGQFTANGAIDYHWTLNLKFLASTAIKRIELYQTNENGDWHSGQAWSTAEFIDPIEGPSHFHVFPLGVFDDGANPNVLWTFTHQLNSAYTDAFGTFAAREYRWTLVGQPAAPLNGYFKLIIFLGDGTRMQSIIPTTCGDPPPPCLPPATPTIVGICSTNGDTVRVTMAVAGGTAYNLFIKQSAPCGDGMYHLASSGITVSNPQSIDIAGLVSDCQTCAYISVDEGACGFISSAESCCPGPIPLAIATISVSPMTTTGIEPVTVSWTSGKIDDDGTVVVVALASNCDSQVAISSTPNTSGSITLNPGDPGYPLCDRCYKITSTNDCGPVSAQACVIVSSPVTCTCLPSFPSSLCIQGFNANSFFNCSGRTSLPQGSTATAWNGCMSFRNGQCKTGFLPHWDNDGGAAANEFVDQFYPLGQQNATVGCDGTSWILSINSSIGGLWYWYGSKPLASGPAGAYTRTSHPSFTCTGPSTITLV